MSYTDVLKYAIEKVNTSPPYLPKNMFYTDVLKYAIEKVITSHPQEHVLHRRP